MWLLFGAEREIFLIYRDKVNLEGGSEMSTQHLTKNTTTEWSTKKKWNPFNSFKLLSHVYRWRQIERGGEIPQPALVTVDPINICNYKCVWCNSESVLNHNNNKLSKKTLINIAKFLSEWRGSRRWEKGVEAVCVAGGGEPLLNSSVGDFIEECVKMKIEVGVVTNGALIDKYIEPLSLCSWVGVSVDAASERVMKELKGIEHFNRIVENIKQLTEYSKKNKTKLSNSSQGYGVSYKWLIHPQNISEIYKGAEIAKNIGCKNFHMRPVGIPWHKLGENLNADAFFGETLINEFNTQVIKARTLEDDNFGVFGITHKFDHKFDRCNQFSNCYAMFMTAVFVPSSGENNDKFSLGLCCDRRGDESLMLCKDIELPEEINKYWGSEEHWRIFDNVTVNKCPRCTYQPHNQIYEHVILEDSMTYKFI